MLKRQNNKLNSVGVISCSLLLLLAFLAINPIASDSAYAVTGTSTNISDGESSSDPATATISLTPTSATTSITPTTAEGSLARVDVKADIAITNTGGYSIYLSSKNVNLTGEKTGATIGAATSATTFQNLQTNTWAYTAVEGTTIPDSATYSALPAAGATLKSVSGNKDSVSHTYMLSFATKIGNDKPADLYKNQITFSATVSPKVLTLSQLTNMQDITTATCPISAVGETKQLKDTRDGKYYWVTKLADQKCWMTQNLDLDLSTTLSTNKNNLADRITFTSDDTDLNSKSSWTPDYPTFSVVSANTIFASGTGQMSWSLGNYRIKNPTISSDCSYGKSSAANCPSQFTTYATPTSANNSADAHYILGNHYQWDAATAGSGGNITSGQAQDSICPKGWKLPESKITTAGSFGGLIDAGSIGTNVTLLTSAPYYFVRGGAVTQDAGALYSYAGSNGDYWSSTPYSDSSDAYILTFYDSNTINPSSNIIRIEGRSVRCIAR